MSIRLFFMITIGALIGLLIHSCSGKGNNNRPIDLVVVKKESDRFSKNKDYDQFVGKTGQIEIVQIEVNFKSLTSSRKQLKNSNPIEIPFHCSPVIITDILAIITNPQIYSNDLRTLVVVQYKSDDGFNFSNGGDNVDLYLLKNNDQVSIPAAFNKHKVLYEIKNDSFGIIKRESELNASGFYTFDYKMAQIIESHKIKFLGKKKFKIFDLKNCD